MNWLSPLWLWALPLVIVPPIIHYLFRRRFRRIPWAAVELLRRALQRRQKRRQLEEWLLLAMRMLIIAGLVLGFAQPEALTSASALSALRRPQIIFFDVSLSTQRQEGLRSVSERLREDALQFVDDLDRNRPLMLCLTPGTTVVEGRNAVIDTLRGATPTWLAGRWVDSVAEVDRQLKDRGVADCDVALFTDFQRSDFAGLESWPPQWRLEPRGPDLPRGANNRVARLTPGAGFPGSYKKWSVHCRLEGDPGPVNLKLLVDDNLVRQEDVEIPLGGRLDLMWPVPLAGERWHQITARLSDDTFAFDNKRHLCVLSRPRPHVVFVSPPEDHDALEVFVRALDPRNECHIERSPLPPRNLVGTDLLIWTKPTPPAGLFVDQLTQAVEEGLIFVTFIAPRAAAEDWAQALPWLPGFSAEPKTVPQSFLPDPSALFSGWGRYFRRHLFSGYRALDEEGRVLWRDAAYQPVLLDGRRGLGSWVVAGMGLGSEHGDWMGSGPYVGLARLLLTKLSVDRLKSREWVSSPEGEPDMLRPGVYWQEGMPQVIHPPDGESILQKQDIETAAEPTEASREAPRPWGLTLVTAIFAFLLLETYWTIRRP